MRVMSRVSQRQYAARLGVSHVYVNRMVREGKLRADEKGRIDPDEADRVLAALREPARPSRRGSKAPVVGVGSAGVAGQASGVTAAGLPERGDLPTLLLKTRIKSEAERGKLLELKAKVEAGKFVDADEVKVAAFNTGRMVRDNLLNIPGRLAGLVAAESDESKCFALIDTEIRQTLEALTGGPGDE